eukprot:5446701-Pyramimonas_sp.AAC.1
MGLPGLVYDESGYRGSFPYRFRRFMRGDDCLGAPEQLGPKGRTILGGSALVWGPAVGSAICALIRPSAG